ncbi:hypothetical protein SLS58_009535 [Diplodia intermedia]|uniref:Alkali metal cation/H+ antiporter Nha1 C-terminal domain-containing protein n=1 Tax=Diplodia intermedia TaxID=856260 RepID=A0ABR3TBR5_9PEZI
MDHDLKDTAEHPKKLWHETLPRRYTGAEGEEAHEKKRVPALAYQVGNTIVVEDEDGEVVKKYDIPQDAMKHGGEKTPIIDKTRQRLARMGTYLGMSHGEAHAAAGQADVIGESSQGAAKPQSRNDTEAKTQEARRKTTRAFTAIGNSFGAVDHGTFDDAEFRRGSIKTILEELDYKNQDPQELGRVSSILPHLLQAFASKAGYGSSSEAFLSILNFINTRRTQIARSFLEQVLPTEEFEDEDDTDDENVKTDSGHITAASIRQWQEGLELAIEPEDVELTSPYIDPDEDDEPDETELPSYRKLVVGTPEFDWLIGNIRKELVLQTAPNSAVEAISGRIRACIRSMRRFRHISRRQQPEACQALFEVDCDILGFSRSQNYEVQSREAIGTAVTLTGTIIDAQACTCAQYMRQTWPTTGIATLELLEHLVAASGAACELKWLDGTHLKAWAHEKKITVEATGVGESIAEVGEQLSWLGSTLRPSPHETGVALCTPVVHVRASKQKLPMRPADDRFTRPFVPDVFCQLGFTFSENTALPELVQGRCWQSMFRNQIVVEGFPTPRRNRPNTGLEIPLDVMARLVDTQRIDFFNGKFFLKGFSSMLVPTAQFGDLVLWHHLYNKNGDRISYLDADMDHLRDLNWSQLEQARHVVGWSSEIRCFAGAADAELNIGRSRLPATGAGCVLDKVSISGGKFVTGSASISIGVRDKPIHISRNGYVSRLQWISQRYVVFWDVQAKRGWLVNGTNALLHIVRASIHHNRTDEFGSLFEFLLDPESIKEADITHTTKSAIDVLTDHDNMVLRLYPDKPQQDIKMVHKQVAGDAQDPPPEAVTEDKSAFYRFQDRVDEIYNVLEKIIDQQIDAAGQSGMKLSAKARKHLEGWDFKDLATSKDPVYPRVAKLSAMGYGWVDFTRAIQAITLFGKGFGELIQPEGSSTQCKKWSRVPEGRYYLAAAVSDMRKIMELDGDPDANPMRVCESLIWYNPVTPFGPPCSCERDPSPSTVHPDPVQVLFPSRMRALLPRMPPIKLGDQGGVIFGHNLNYPEWHYGDRGEPVRGEMPISDEAEDAALDPHDSGSTDVDYRRFSPDLEQCLFI